MTSLDTFSTDTSVKIVPRIWFHEQGSKAIEARAAIRYLGIPTTSISHLI